MSSQQVIRSYLTIAGLYTMASSIIWGVNTLFLLDAGLTIAEVFMANAIFTAGMMVFEIPTGVLADTAGRRVSFLLSVIILCISTLGYVAGNLFDEGFAWFAVFSVFLGLGFTFYSGATEAWLVDALEDTDYQGELDHVFARSAQVTGAAMLIGSIGGGVLGTLDLELPYLVRAGLLLAVFFYAYRTMFDLGYEARELKLSHIPAEMRKLTGASIRFGWQESNIRLLMLVAFLQYGFMTWAFYAWQPYLLELYGDPNAIWIAGVFAALISVATILGNTFTEWETHRSGRRTTLMIGAVGMFSLAMIGVGLTSNFWLAAALLLLAMGMVGVAGPVRQSYIHHIVPTEQRATVLSVDSMFSSGGGILSQTTLGQVSQQVGIAEGYIFGGLATTIAVPILFLLRNLGSEADVIIGEAGHQGGCAGQGLPQITTVDAKPRHPLPAEGTD